MIFHADNDLLLHNMGRNYKKFKKSEDKEESIKVTDFKTAFKYYKSRNPEPDLENVVDVENEKQKDSVFEIDILKLENIKDATVEPENCKPYSEWRVFRFRDIEGITLIRNVFSEEHQLLWAQRCIQVKFQ